MYRWWATVCLAAAAVFIISATSAADASADVITTSTPLNDLEDEYYIPPSVTPLQPPNEEEDQFTADNETLQILAQEQRQCPSGLIIPGWAQDRIDAPFRALKGLVYFFCLLYLFLGVSIISDRFMGAIEVITSQEREVVLNKKGERKTVLVRVWNETVANLTLMALGSSAPEIMLSVIEIWAEGFQAGDLGPGTIVGSAAYNLFVIIAICICVIPKGETRRIKQLSVFFVTATWSVFAYIWLYVILSVTSEGVVEVWEGILTFLFFPLTVLTAFIADKRKALLKLPIKLFMYKWRPAVTTNDVDIELTHVEDEEPMDLVEQARLQSTNILKELKDKYPDKTMQELTAMAQEKLQQSGTKSRAFYRIQATRNLTGGSMTVRGKTDLAKPEEDILPEDDKTYVRFAEAEYTVLENVGSFPVKVILEGPAINQPILVDYRSEDGSANAGSDYIAVSGTLLFKPGQNEQYFKIKILDDDVFEEDEHFFVHLLNVRIQDSEEENEKLTLGELKTCKVWILDDDHSGSFTFPEESVDVPETVGEYEVLIERRTGARGRVNLPYYTHNGTAIDGIDYIAVKGVLEFSDNEPRKTLPIKIISKNSYERNTNFFIHLEPPIQINGDTNKPKLETDEEPNPEGRPVLGEFPVIQVNIRESLEFRDTVDKLVEARATPAVIVGTTSWQEQFAEAVKLTPECEEEGGTPSFLDYVMHYLALFWKIIFAFVPPTDMLHGWICFWVSISCIGILTAFIRDVASAFGCTVGIKDAVTAISIVALGTSLPDTFASKVSAIGDDTADNSVGNVTGSNAVNVFLGIGVAWSIAALYHEYHGNKFYVPPGNLAFSVTLFCSEALVAILIIVCRRSKYIGGELGGPETIKYVTSGFLILLWLIYVTVSTLEAYDVIEGF